MFKRSGSFNTTGSNRMGFESASFCASFFAALLLLVDTVLAVSIFVSAGILGGISIIGILVSLLVCVILLRVLLIAPDIDARPNLSAA